MFWARGGSSSNNAVLGRKVGEVAVKLSTMEAGGSEAFRGKEAFRGEAWRLAPLFGGRYLPCLGESGEKDGNDVRDLSDGATEDAELEV